MFQGVKKEKKYIYTYNETYKQKRIKKRSISHKILRVNSSIYRKSWIQIKNFKVKIYFTLI